MAANSRVFSQQLMKAGTAHVLRRILHFRWLGQTVLRIHLSHGVYANFKVNFSHCSSSQSPYVFSFLFLFTILYVVFTVFYHHFDCQFNLRVAKTIKSCLILSYLIRGKAQSKSNVKVTWAMRFEIFYSQTNRHTGPSQEIRSNRAGGARVGVKFTGEITGDKTWE